MATEGYGFSIDVSAQSKGLSDVLAMLKQVSTAAEDAQRALDRASSSRSSGSASSSSMADVTAQLRSTVDMQTGVRQSAENVTRTVVDGARQQESASRSVQSAERERANDAQRTQRMLSDSYRQQRDAALSYYADVEASQSRVIGAMLKGQAMQQFANYATEASDTIMKAAAQAQQGFAQLNVTQDGSSAARMKELDSSIASVANHMTGTYKDVQSMATDLGQAGVEADKLADATAAVSKFTGATDVGAQKAASSLATVYQQIGDGTYSFQQLANAQFVVSNESAATADQVLKMTTDMAPLSKTLNISTANVIGLGGAMASAGISSSSLNTSVTRTMGQMATALADGGDKAQAFSSIMGMTSEQLKKSMDKSSFDTYLNFVKALTDSSKGDSTKLAGNLAAMGIQARQDQKILTAVGNNYDAIKKQSADAAKALGSTADLDGAYSKTADTFNGSLQRLKNTLTSIAASSSGLDGVAVPINALQSALERFYDAARGGNPFAVFVSSMASFATPAAAVGGRIASVAGKLTQLGSVSESVRLQYGQMAAATGQYTAQLAGQNDALQRSALAFKAHQAAARADETALSAERNFGMVGASISNARSDIDAKTEGLTRAQILRLEQEETAELRRQVSASQMATQEVAKQLTDGMALADVQRVQADMDRARTTELIKQQQLMITETQYRARAAEAEANSTAKGVGVAGGGTVARTAETVGASASKGASGLGEMAASLGSLMSKAMVGVSVLYGLVSVVTSVVQAVQEANAANRALDAELVNPVKSYEKASRATQDWSDVIRSGQSEYQKTGEALKTFTSQIEQTAEAYDEASGSASRFATTAYTKDMNKQVASDIFNTKSKESFGSAGKDDTLVQIIADAGKASNGVKGVSQSFDGLVKAIQNNAIDGSVQSQISGFTKLGAQIQSVKDMTKGSGAKDIGNIDSQSLGQLESRISELKAQQEMNRTIMSGSGAQGAGAAESMYLTRQNYAIERQVKALQGLDGAMKGAGASASDNVGTWAALSDRFTAAGSSLTKLNDELKTTQYLSSLSAQTPASMDSLATLAESMKSEVEQTNKLRSGLMDVADAGYKASHGLADYSDMGKVSGAVTSQVAEIMDDFKDKPGAAALGLVNLGDTMKAVGEGSGKDMEYVASMLRQVVGQLNTTYGFNIDTGPANASVDQLKANIQSAVAALGQSQAMMAAVSSNKDSTSFFRGVIRMHALSNQMQLSEASAQQAATQAAKDNTKATDGNSKAKKANSDANRENIRTVDDLASDMESLVKWYNQFAYGVSDAQDGISDALKDIDDGLKKTEELSDKVSDSMEKLFGRSDAKDALLSQLDSMRKGIADAREQWDQLNATLADQQAQDSQLKYWLKQAQAVGDVAREQELLSKIQKNSTEMNATKSSMSTQKAAMTPTATGDTSDAIAQRKALEDLAKQYMEYGVAMKKAGASDDEVRAAMSRMRGEFDTFGRSLGFSESELRPYLDALGSTIYAMDETKDSSKSASEQMKDLVKRYQSLASAMVAAGMSQSQIDSAMRQGAGVIASYGSKLGLTKSQTDGYVNSLIDMSTLVRNLPPVQLRTNLSPVQNALTLFWNKMKEDAAKTSKSAGGALTGGGGSGGSGGGGGSLKQSLSELLDAQIKMERESLASFSQYMTTVTTMTDKDTSEAMNRTKAKVIDGLLNISTMTTLSTDDQRKAWESAYDKIDASSTKFQSKMIQSLDAVAEENGVTSNAAQGAWDASVKFMSERLNGKDQDSFKSQFKAGMMSVYKQSNMSSDDIANDWKSKVDSYKGYMPEQLRDELYGWGGEFKKAGNSTADAVSNGITDAFNSRRVQDAISSAVYRAMNPGNGWTIGQDTGSNFVRGLQSWINGSSLNLGQMMSNSPSYGPMKGGYVFGQYRGGLSRGFAGGGSYGLLRGAGSTTGDSNLTALSDWEFVTRASVVRSGNNLSGLQYLNRTGQWPVNAVIGGGSGISPELLTAMFARTIAAIQSNGNVAVPVAEISASQRRMAAANGRGYFG